MQEETEKDDVAKSTIKEVKSRGLERNHGPEKESGGRVRPPDRKENRRYEA